MKTKNLVLFWDWNGTVVDDSFVFVNILNVLLEKKGLPKITLAFYKENFCFPVVDFYKKLGLYKSLSFFSSLNKDFIQLYNQQKNAPKLKKNIVALIGYLNNRGVKQFVVSAQNNKTLTGLVSFYGLKQSFVAVVGVDNDLAYGKKGFANSLKKKYCNKKNNIIVVGDTFLDFEVSQHIGARCLLVDWGHYSFGRLSCCGVPVFSSVGGLKRFLIKDLGLASL